MILIINDSKLLKLLIYSNHAYDTEREKILLFQVSLN